MTRGRNKWLLSTLKLRWCATLLLSALVFNLASIVLAQTLVYDFLIEVETKSDWTRVSLSGGYIVDYTYEVVESAPGLMVEVQPSSILIGKRQYDTAEILLRIRVRFILVREALDVTVTKGDLEYTTVRVYASESFENPIWTFTNSGTVPESNGLNPRSMTLGKDLLLQHAKGIEELKPSESPPVKLVLAFYYPWYANPQGPSGRWYHWERVTLERIGSAADYPLMGPYDSWDERVVRSHVKMAKAAGIDGFVCSWWGIGTFEDNAFERVLKVAAEEGFSVTIYYESMREMPQEQVIQEISYVISKYSKEQGFLKLDGKPVLFIYAVNEMDRSLEFWKSVVSEVEERTGVEAVYIGDTYNLSFLSLFDGLHTYSPIWIGDHRSTYAAMSEMVKSYVTVERGSVIRRLWVASVTPGYDDTKIRRPGQKVPRENGKYYEKTWSAALESEPDIVVICSWNEWHEGSEIEPSEEYAFDFLVMTKKFVEAYKDLSLPDVEDTLTSLAVNTSGRKARLTVMNIGAIPAVIIRITISSPSGLLEVSGSGAYIIHAGSTARVFIPYLASGESLKLEVEAPANSTGELSVRAEGKAWTALGKGAELGPVEFVLSPVSVEWEVRGLALPLLLLALGTSVAAVLCFRLRRKRNS